MLGNYSKKHRLALLTYLILGLTLIPSAAHADSGTPLILAGMFHMVLGNLIIGVGEGYLIDWLFHLKRKSAVGIMILANYVSAIIGVCIIPRAVYTISHSRFMPTPLYDMPKILWTMVLISFVVTIIIEWPFCLWALRRDRGKGKRIFKTSVKVSILAQTASYLLLLPWFFICSSKTLYTDVSIDRTLSFARNTNALVYYISIQDGNIYRVNADGTGRTLVIKSNLTNPNARIFVRPPKGIKYRNWDLWIQESDQDSTQRILRKHFATVSVSPTNNWDHDRWPMSYGKGLDFRPKKEREWHIFVDYWAARGLSAYNKEKDLRVNAGLETPFLLWFSRYPTILPGDQVVYQLGDQIVILDLNKRKIGLLAVGRSPVVTLGGKD